jgi:hypothetical protein
MPEDNDAHMSPPVPVHRNLVGVDVEMVASSAWLQPAPERESVATFQFYNGEGEAEVVALEAARTPNPLRSLAAALVVFADQLDRTGVVPLGIHVRTVYCSFGQTLERRVARVTTSVRGVRREWIDQHAGTSEKAESDG